MKIHFIAIGGSAMHNLAIALHKEGHQISGSDDEIFEPSRSRLAKYNILPQQIGWDVSRVTSDLDAVILGMHARIDNPELVRAKALGLKIYSYPEYLYEQSKDKIRIVIGGSHGKTTITSMIIHAFQKNNIASDYMVGAMLEGFDVMVKFSKEAKYMVIEGDEYLTSPIDRVPKFHHYHPNIALLSGVAWDHINVFPSFDNYLDQFRIFLDTIEEQGALVYYKHDKHLKAIVGEKERLKYDVTSYEHLDYVIEDGVLTVYYEGRGYPLKIFGKHNVENLTGAMWVCQKAGMSADDFLRAMMSFKGASNRLEEIYSTDSTKVFKDFAHAPSKLRATLKAVKEQYPERSLIACMELHTFSSLSVSFLREYENTMSAADKAFVYFDPEAVRHKKLPELKKEDVIKGFAGQNVEVINDVEELVNKLKNLNWTDKNLLLMSSGNFGGINFIKLANELTQK